jgi:flagellar hook-associated protein 2
MSFSLQGIASGLDTATIISQLMQMERVPYTKLQSKQTALNSQITAMRTINTKLNTLRTAAEELLTKSNFNLRKVSVSDSSVLTAASSSTTPAENSYNINVTQLASRHAVKSVEFKAGDVSSLTGSIVINGTTIDIKTASEEDEEPLTNDDVLTQLMNDINSKKVGVKASIIETRPGWKTLVLTSEKSGTANKIVFGTGSEDEEDTHVYIDTSGLNTAPPASEPEDPESEHFAPSLESSVFGFTEIADSGKDAILTVNGIEVVASSNELTNVISGLNISLKKVGETTININSDADKTAEKVDAFVKAYNDVINTIKGYTGKGKDLQGDATVRSLESYLYGLFNRKVDVIPAQGSGSESTSSPLRYMFEIGLEIEKTGTIKFDKEKFKTALAERPDEVYQLFARDESTNNGIARVFKDSLMDWTRSGTGILAVKIEGYDSQIAFVKQQMEAMETRLTMKEEKLNKQFAAMETALSSLQNEQSWLSSQLASLY